MITPLPISLCVVFVREGVSICGWSGEAASVKRYLSLPLVAKIKNPFRGCECDEPGKHKQTMILLVAYR